MLSICLTGSVFDKNERESNAPQRDETASLWMYCSHQSLDDRQLSSISQHRKRERGQVQTGEMRDEMWSGRGVYKNRKAK